MVLGLLPLIPSLLKWGFSASDRIVTMSTKMPNMPLGRTDLSLLFLTLLALQGLILSLCLGCRRHGSGVVVPTGLTSSFLCCLMGPKGLKVTLLSAIMSPLRWSWSPQADGLMGTGGCTQACLPLAPPCRALSSARPDRRHAGFLKVQSEGFSKDTGGDFSKKNEHLLISKDRETCAGDEWGGGRSHGLRSP